MSQELLPSPSNCPKCRGYHVPSKRECPAKIAVDILADSLHEKIDRMDFIERRIAMAIEAERRTPDASREEAKQAVELPDDERRRIAHVEDTWRAERDRWLARAEQAEAALAEMKASRDHWKSSAEQHCKSATDWHAKFKEATASREAEQRVIEAAREGRAYFCPREFPAPWWKKMLEALTDLDALTAPAQKPGSVMECLPGCTRDRFHEGPCGRPAQKPEPLPAVCENCGWHYTSHLMPNRACPTARGEYGGHYHGPEPKPEGGAR